MKRKGFVLRRAGVPLLTLRWMVWLGVVAGRTAAGSPAESADAFAAFCRARAAEAREAGEAVVRGTPPWLFLTSELRHLGVGPFWGVSARMASAAAREDARDPLPVIVDTARQLRERGIALLVVPVPPRAVVYADALCPDGAWMVDGGPHPGLADALATFYTLLQAEGVAVLDLSPALRTARLTDGEAGPVYCMQDSHWRPRGAAVAAREVAAWIHDNTGVPPGDLATVSTEETVDVSGDLWRMLGDETLARETVPLLRVTDSSGGLIVPDPLSPVLVLADSHGLVFSAGGDMHATGAGWVEHLVAALGRPVDVIARRGSAATAVRIDLARRIRADSAFASTKRVVVWCFAARELTESSGWRDVPLFPEPSPAR